MSSIEASGSLKYTDPLSSIIFPALIQVDGEIMITSEREYLESNEGHLAMYHSNYPVDISFPSLVNCELLKVVGNICRYYIRTAVDVSRIVKLLTCTGQHVNAAFIISWVPGIVNQWFRRKYDYIHERNSTTLELAIFMECDVCQFRRNVCKVDPPHLDQDQW
mgnify:CR=1 FL=1